MDTVLALVSEIASAACAKTFVANIEPITTTKIIITFLPAFDKFSACLETINKTLVSIHITTTNKQATVIISSCI